MSEWPSGDDVTSPVIVGGGGGGRFESTRRQADGTFIPVKKMEVFAGNWLITGIRMTFADGYTSQMYGTSDGPQYVKTFDFQAGEKVTKATIWPTQHKDRFAQVYIKTDRNRDWYGSDRNWWNTMPQDVNVGSGVLVGIGGASGTHVDRLGLVFLAGEWPVGPNFTPKQFAGGSGGSAFEATKWSAEKGYAPVSKIEVFSGDWVITGIKLTFADGSQSQMIGSTGKSSEQYTFERGELVTKATIWPTEHKNRLAQIMIKTNKDKDKEWYATGRSWWNTMPQGVDCGSGLFVGVGGRSGTEIDRAGLVFLKSKVKKITIRDLKYKNQDAWDHPETIGGLEGHVLMRGEYVNNGPGEILNWSFENGDRRTTTTTFTQDATTGYGANVEVSVEGKILGVGASAKAGFQYNWSTSTTRATEETREMSIHWGPISGQLKIGEGVVCQALTFHGKASLDYNAQVVVTFEDSKQQAITYREDGTLGQALWSQAQIITTPVRL